MKSDFVGIGEVDLISSEALAEDFIQTCLDFILQSRISFLLLVRFCDTIISLKIQNLTKECDYLKIPKNILKKLLLINSFYKKALASEFPLPRLFV